MPTPIAGNRGPVGVAGTLPISGVLATLNDNEYQNTASGMTYWITPDALTGGVMSPPLDMPPYEGVWFGLLALHSGSVASVQTGTVCGAGGTETKPGAQWANIDCSL